LVPTATLEPAAFDVKAANGSVINILSHMTIKFAIQGKELKADLLVADDVDEFMLGFVWLTAQKAKWDFNAKTPTLHGFTVPLCTRQWDGQSAHDSGTVNRTATSIPGREHEHKIDT